MGQRQYIVKHLLQLVIFIKEILLDLRILSRGIFMDRTEFLLRLKLQKGIGYRKLLRLAQVLAWNEQVELTYQQVCTWDWPQEFKQNIRRVFTDLALKATADRIHQQCQVISFFDQIYPRQLSEIYQPPILLFCRGQLKLLTEKIMVVVGSRQPTDYSRQIAQDLLPLLIKKNYVIASGLASGVDQLAHEETLNHCGRTIAVIGNGLNQVYPRKNYDLQKQIARDQLLISEYLPDTPPRPYYFPQRNRILAGLSQGVIVTEAKKRSGSLITANLALQENRDVYAIPGPITQQLSQGPNQLIAAGAIPITSLENCDWLNLI
jgi:DNA processing protein